jgi:archaellum component FlaC
MKEFLKEFENEGKMNVSVIMDGEALNKLREDVERLENEKKSLQRRIESMSKENSGNLKE